MRLLQEENKKRYGFAFDYGVSALSKDMEGERRP
jgi:hypothetical protein